MIIREFYVGFTSESTGQLFMPEPQAPSNYKDLTKIAEYKQAKLEAWKRERASWPHVAEITDAVLLDSAGDIVLQTIASDVAIDKLSAFIEGTDAAMLIGIEVQRFIRLLLFSPTVVKRARDDDAFAKRRRFLMEGALQHKRLPTDASKEIVLFDPYDFLTIYTERAAVTLPELLKLHGIPAPQGDSPAARVARAARDLHWNLC